MTSLVLGLLHFSFQTLLLLRHFLRGRPLNKLLDS